MAYKHFAIIFVLGAPGAGKGTLCTHLARVHNLVHFSVGDSLRAYMRANRHSPLADRIQQKLDQQGFLTFEELDPFLFQAIKDAMKKETVMGILVDGFPRCVEQANAFTQWPFQVELPLRGRKPDLVLSFNVTKEKARARYVARARDSNDSEEKFESRFLEYETESPLVEEAYQRAGILISVDVNGTKEENVKELTRELEENDLWRRTIVE